MRACVCDVSFSLPNPMAHTVKRAHMSTRYDQLHEHDVVLLYA